MKAHQVLFKDELQIMKATKNEGDGKVAEKIEMSV